VAQPSACFYFDLASPLAYLAAEQLPDLLPGAVAWEPVLARELPGGELPAVRDEIAARARELGLQPVRWPSPFPFDSALAMRVATYAKSIGRAVPFALAAFRQAFAGGHSLEVPDHVLVAAAACEMHPAAVLRGAELRSVDRALSGATARAARRGVLEVPAVVVGEAAEQGGSERLFGAARRRRKTRALLGGRKPRPTRAFLGARAVEQAAAHIRGLSKPGSR
jgi:2-hydroxychromene-2-carboxylate isomerase